MATLKGISPANAKPATVEQVENSNTAIPGKNDFGGGSFCLSPMNEYIGSYFQTLRESCINNSYFYQTSSTYMLPFWKIVQNHEQWYNGFVPTFHDFKRGVVPTHFAKAVVDKVANIIYGGGIAMTVSDNLNAEGDFGKENIIDVMSDWASKCDFRSKVQDAIRMMCVLGTSVLKLNIDSKNEIWIEALSLSRCSVDLDAEGRITKATSYILPVEHGTNSQNKTLYNLVEEREYINGIPAQTYRVYKINKTVNNSPTQGIPVEWQQLPHSVRESIQKSYANIRIGEPVPNPFPDLGVYALKFTPSVSRMPWLKYGDSVLSGIEEYLCLYDILNAMITTDMYCGRARIIANKHISKNGGGYDFNAGFDSFMFTYLEHLTTEENKPTVMQPDIRHEAFKGLRNMIIENICTTVQISPSSFASFLQDSSNRTAREVSAEESATTLFAENHRDLIIHPLNELLKTVAKFKGYVSVPSIQFSKAGQTNYTLLTENIVRQYEAKLISLQTAVEQLHPEMTEEQRAAEIERIKKEEQEKQVSLFGDLGNSIEGVTDYGTE